MSRFDPLPGMPSPPGEEPISYITAIAALTGIAPGLIAVAAQHLLGAVAGHNAWLTGAAGEVIRPAFSLIVAGGDDPRWQRALELLLTPLLACQHRSREVSRGCRPDLLREVLEGAEKRSNTLDLVTGDVRSSPFGEGVMVNVNRRFDVLEKPLTLLEAPDLAAYLAGMKAAMDREALVVYRDGSLLEQALVRRPTEFANQLTQALARAINGCSEHVPEKNRAVDPCAMERTQVTLHVSASTQTVREALLSDRPALNHLLASSIILPVTFSTASKSTYSRSQLTAGYGMWRSAVMDVFTARRDGGGMRFQIADPDHAALMDFNQNLLSRLNDLPEGSRARYQPLLAFPYRLMWGLMAAWRGQVDAQDVTAFTDWAFAQQQTFLSEVDVEIFDQERALFKERIWKKLIAKAPCTRRTLMRCFSIQRSGTFEPLLKELADEQRIRYLDGFIEVLEDARALQEISTS